MPNQRIPRNTILSILLATGALGSATIAPHALAQTAPPTPAAVSAPQKVDKIEVTGSNIKRVEAESSQPITVITSEDIKRSGATSVQELLNNLSVSSGTALTDIGSGSGFSTGVATAALRGLGSAATLTLLNGRRISPAAFNDPNVGQTVVTNLNSIPAQAIERIEVLRDGASAIYGSDAIAGVINIILRKDFNGALVSGTVSQSPRNEFLQKTVSATFGFGDVVKDRYNVFGTYERFEREPVMIKSEDNVSAFLQHPTVAGLGRLSVLSTLAYPGNYYREAVAGSRVFGTLVAARAGCATVVSGTCRYNQWEDLEQAGKSVRDTAYMRATIELSPSLSGFAEASYSRAVNTYTAAPLSSNPTTATVWRNAAGQLLTFQLVLPVGHRENPYTFPVGLRYRWVDLGRSQDISTTEDSRVLAGLKGNWSAWDWESSLLYNKSTAEVSSGRRLLFPAIQTAINDGSYNFSGPNSQAVIDRVSARTTNYGEGSAKIWDLKGSREFGNLAGGSIGVAAGIDYRSDTIVITPDRRVVDAQIVGLGGSFADGSRNVKSAYLETVLPFSKSAELTLAARHDRYSDFGSTTNPKVGIKWRPFNNLVARASYSTGFRAPTLSQMSRSSVRSFQAVNDPIRCPVTGTNDDCGVTASISAQIVQNPNLKPETSSSRTAGIVWDVSKDFSLTLDYFDIRRDDEIDRFSSNFQVNALFNGDQRFATSVFRDPNPLTWIAGVPNSGPVTGVNRIWLNLGGTQVTGFDLEGTHRMNLGTMGRLTTTGSFTVNRSALAAREKGQTMINYIGAVSAVTGQALPRYKGNLGTTWTYQDWTFGARVNYTGSWTNYNSQFTCAQWNGPAAAAALPEVCRVKAWRTVDINASYTGIKNLTLRLVVRNLTDEQPPFDFYNGDVQLGFNPQFHNALGIYPSLSATYRFK